MASKRGNNEGSIRKRPDGRWEARISLADGKRKSIYGETRTQVAKRMAAAMRDRDIGLPTLPERQTVGQFLQSWLETSVRLSVRPRTYASYKQLVRLHISPGLGPKVLARLTPQEVQSFLNAKLASGLSARTVQYLRAVLRRALGQAMRWSLVARNVAALTEPPKTVRSEIRPLTPKQARILLETARSDRLEALYSMALAVGLRQGEALGLHWSDIDLEARRLTVRTALPRLDGKLRLVEPKTESSRRTIPLPAAVVEPLLVHRERQQTERLVAGDQWQETGLVFTTRLGTPLDPRNLTRSFKALLARAGLPDLRFHDLRHTCATLLLVQDVSPRVIMETLGHSQISLTLNTYSHVIPALQHDAARRMDAVLAGEPAPTPVGVSIGVATPRR